MPDTQVQTKSRIGIAIGLSIAAGLAGVIGVGFALVQVSGEGGGGGGSTTTTTNTGSGTGDGGASLISSFKPQAMLLKDLTSGTVVPYFAGFDGTFPGIGSVQVLAGSTVLGTFSHETFDGPVTFTDGQALSAPRPVTLKVIGDTAENGVTDYARLVLGTDAGEKTICIPQSDPPILGPTWYVDTNGGTYQDSKLTKWTMLCSYPEMEFRSISSATTSAPIVLPSNVQGGIVQFYAPHFYYQTAIAGGNVMFGLLHPNGSWVQAGVALDVPKPLAVYLWEGAEVDADGNLVRYIKLSYPEQVLTLQTDRGSRTVCLPAGRSNDKFFVAPNGNSYTDIWLTKLARACP